MHRPATNPETHDARFEAKVREALTEKTAPISAVEVEAHFAKRRAESGADES